MKLYLPLSRGRPCIALTCIALTCIALKVASCRDWNQHTLKGHRGTLKGYRDPCLMQSHLEYILFDPLVTR